MSIEQREIRVEHGVSGSGQRRAAGKNRDVSKNITILYQDMKDYTSSPMTFFERDTNSNFEGIQV